MEFVEKTNARIITLDTNYRSTAGILGAAGRLISANVDRVEKRITAHRGDGPPPQVHFCEDSDDQTSQIVLELDRICHDNPPVPSNAEGVPPYRFTVRPGQAAILARTNQHLMSLEIDLISWRVPYLRTGSGFWKHRTVQTYVAILSALADKQDVGLQLALRWGKVPDTVLADLMEAGKGSIVGLLDLLDLPTRRSLPGGPVVQEFLDCITTWRRKLAGRPQLEDTRSVIFGVAGWMTAVLRGTCGVDLDDAHELPAPSRAQMRDIGRIEAVRDLLSDKFRGSLAQRLRAATQQDGDGDLPRVILSTFHASKGMEWDHVFLTDVVDGIVPNLKDSGGGDAAVAEERRVFYVAMTRARNSLHIYSNLRKASEFLYDAGLITGADVAYAQREQANLVRI